jgi:DNA primase
LKAGADLVIVEGPMDAAAVTAAGGVAVAPLGTALTAEQLTTLDRVAPLADRRIIVALDNDAAGIHAARAAHTLLLAAGVHTSETVTLPASQDPAQVLAEQGPQRLAATLTETRPLASLVVDDITAQWLTRIPQGQPGIEERFNAVQEAAPVIAAMGVAERNRQAGRLAELTRLDLFRVLDSIERHVPPPAPVLVGDLQMPQPPVKRELVMAEVASPDVAERLQAGRDRAAQLRDERNARKLAAAEAQQVAVKPEHSPTHKPVIQPAVQNRLHL